MQFLPPAWEIALWQSGRFPGNFFRMVTNRAFVRKKEHSGKTGPKTKGFGQMKKWQIGVWIFSLAMLTILLGCEGAGERKIRLATGNAQSQTRLAENASVVRLSPENQYTIAINLFQNLTDDPSLNWLSRGLADMLTMELSQSPYLNVVTLNHSGEEAQQKAAGKQNDGAEIAKKLVLARESGASIFLSGQYYREKDRLFLKVHLFDVATAQPLRREIVEGAGLEQIFSMVDELSERVRHHLQGNLEERQYAAIDLQEMTQSVDAYRCYSEALDYIGKLLFAEAEKCLDDALRHDPEFASGYLRLAIVKKLLGKEPEMETALQKARELAGRLSKTDFMNLKILESELTGDYKTAFTELKAAVQQFPTNSEFRLRLASLYYGMGDYDRALQEFETILAQDPNHKFVYNMLGYTFAARGDFVTAIKYIDEYKKLAPDEPNPYDSKGEILLFAGRMAEAERELSVVLDRWPNFFHSASRLADIATENGDLQKALRYSDYVLKRAPSQRMKTGGLLHRAMIYWRFGKFREAEKILTQLMEEDPSSIYPVRLAAEMYKSRKMDAELAALEQRTLAYFGEKIIQSTITAGELDGVAYFCLNSDLPPHQLLQLLDAAISTAENPELRTLLRFARGYNLMRAGETAQAEQVFATYSEDLIDLVTLKRNLGWGAAWKYIFQALDGSTNLDPVHHPFSKRLLEIARDTGRNELEYIAQFAQARFYGLNQKPDRVREIYQELGTPRESRWHIIGPFHPGQFSGFNYPFPPEIKQDENESYQYEGQTFRWLPGGDQFADGYLNFRDQFPDSYWAVGYAWTYVYSPTRRKVQIRLGTDEACKLWLNDELIWQHYIRQDALLDRDMVTVVLHPGYNKLLLKITNTDFDWGFYFRVTDENGRGWPDISFHSPDQVDVSLSSLR